LIVVAICTYLIVDIKIIQAALMGYTRWPRLCFLSHCVNAGVSKPRGDDTFCVIGNVGGGKLKDAAMRCVLRPIDASKCVCRLRELTALPTPRIAGFGEGNREGEESIGIASALWLQTGADGEILLPIVLTRTGGSKC